MAYEDNRNVIATYADLDIELLWVRMKVPSRNSDFFDSGISLPILAEVFMAEEVLSPSPRSVFGAMAQRCGVPALEGPWIFSDNC